MGVRIQTVKKCGFLRQIAERCRAANVLTLHETLLACQRGQFVSTFERGRLVVSQSGSGQSGSYEIGVAGKEWTQDNLFGLVEELIQLLAFTLAEDADLADNAGDPATLSALLAALIENLNSGNIPATGIRTQMGDFTCINA